MTYTPQVWLDKPEGQAPLPSDTPLTAARLNHIEQGVAALDVALAALTAVSALGSSVTAEATARQAADTAEAAARLAADVAESGTRASADAAATAARAALDAREAADAAAAATAVGNEVAARQAAVTAEAAARVAADAAMQTSIAANTAALAAKLDKTEASATYVPKWTAATVYVRDQQVLSPAGQVIYANEDFTSGSTFDASKWHGGLLFQEDFTGSALSSSWGQVRPNAGGSRVTGGALQLDTLAGDISFGVATAQNITLRAVPRTPWQAVAKLTCPLASSGQKVGLIAYMGDDDFVLLSRTARPGSLIRQSNSLERRGSQRGSASADYVDNVSGLGNAWWVKMVWDGRTLTSYDSTDGVTWTLRGRPVPSPEVPYPYIGFYAGDSAGATAVTLSVDFIRVTVPVLAVPVVRQPRLWLSETGVTDPASGTVGAAVLDILLKNAKYLMNTWWTADGYAAQAGPYLTFGGVGEDQIRPAACAAFGLATILATDKWNATTIAATTTVGNTRTVQLAASLAKAHISNTPGGWGFVWQSGMWCALTAQAAWLRWHLLSDTERQWVINMVVAEADRPYQRTPTFWKNPAGTEVYTGDTKGEELAWMSMAWQIAVAMLPDHPNAPQWARQMVSFQAAAWATQSDLASTELLHGKLVKEYLNGWNINNDGTLLNHNKLNADYMAAMTLSMQTAIVMPLADRPIPKVSLRNAALVWGALPLVSFSNPPYAAPGGTMYVAGSANQYYPSGPDWSDAGLSTRVMDKATFDTMIDVLALAPGGVTPNGTTDTPATWAARHLAAVQTLQARSTTGQVYTSTGEDTYPHPEQWITMNAAWAWLTRFVILRQLAGDTIAGSGPYITNDAPTAYV